MKKLLLILLCVPLIGFGQDIPTIYAYSNLQSNFIDWNQYEIDTLLSYEPLRCFNPSSTLSSQGNNNYNIDKMSDCDPKTAWVEGASGFGIGESFEIEVERSHRDIYILNGYQKSVKSWQDNSRVKIFKVYFQGNNKDIGVNFNNPICFVMLNDKMGYQKINLQEEIDHWMEENMPHLDPELAGFELDGDGDLMNFLLIFEISEVYKGERYSDVAISGLYHLFYNHNGR